MSDNVERLKRANEAVRMAQMHVACIVATFEAGEWKALARRKPHLAKWLREASAKSDAAVREAQEAAEAITNPRKDKSQ